MSIRSANPVLRRTLVSNAADASASQAFGVALSILAVTLLGFTTTQVGLLGALGTVAFLVAVPIGVVVDRVGAARVLVSVLLLKVAIVASALILLRYHHLALPAVMMLAGLIGVSTVATENAQTAIVPSLAQETQQITRVVASMASVDRMAAIATPAAVGLLIGTWGGLPVLGIATALSAVAALTAARLWRASVAARQGNVPTPPAGHDTAPEVRSDPPVSGSRVKGITGRLARLTHGFTVLFSTPALLGIVLLSASSNIGLALSDSVATVLILRTLDLGAAFFGLLGTIAAVAAFASSFVAPRIVDRIDLRHLFAIGGTVQALAACLPLCALVIPYFARPLLVAFEVLWALTLSTTNVAGRAFTATAVPQESLGRTSAAAATLTMGIVPIAAIGGGALADTVGMIVPFILWPVLTAVATLSFFHLSRKAFHSSGAPSAP